MPDEPVRIVRREGRESVVRIPRTAYGQISPPEESAVVAATSDEHVDLFVSPALRLGIAARHPLLADARNLAAASIIAAERRQYLWDADVALALGADPTDEGVRQWRSDNDVPRPPATWPIGWAPSPEAILLAGRLLSGEGPPTPRDEPSEPRVDLVSVLAREGDVLDGYHIVRQLGRGGMGVVYAAVDVDLNRSVALKLIAPQMSGDEEARRRFVREARTAASVDHPNAIPIYRVGDVEGLLYIAMRYVDGPTLHEVIRKAVYLDPERALTIMQQTAGALDAAHGAGIVHRDVKPQNILIASHGDSEHVYLSDFGLARLIADTGLTRTGESLGTPSYMAPEQILGRDIDHRADIYSLGCVLYEALTGELPFELDTRHAIYYAHVNSPPPRASEANSSLSEAIDGVIARAMAKQPSSRFDTAGAVVAAARAALSS